MAKSAKITIGETEYTIFPFNIDQLQEVQDILADESPAARRRVPINILKLGLMTADPKVEDPGKLTATIAEVRTGWLALMELSGASPQLAAPVAQADVA
jgi:hypothetical protein